MSSNKEDNVIYHPGIIRKIERTARLNERQREFIDNPITMIFSYILDILFDIASKIISFALSMRRSGSKFIYDIVYYEGTKLIPSADKYGVMINMFPLRLLVTLMFPPLGIFFSYGVSGLHHVVIATALMYFNLLFAIAYAMVMTLYTTYGDKFEEFDYYRLLTIRKLIAKCNNVSDPDDDLTPLILFIISIFIIIGVIYMFVKFI
jgi:hypothetical protein